MSCKDKDGLGMLKDVSRYRKEIQVMKPVILPNTSADCC